MLTGARVVLTMTGMRLRLALLASCIALSPLCACFLAGASADKKIGDIVYNLNNQTRWGRINDASLLVEADYRDTFLDRHRLWGSEIQLADAEVLNIQVANDSEHASAFVNYSWYAMKDMTLHETTLHQRWNARNSSFALSSELVVRGDPGLLSVASNNGSKSSVPADSHPAAP
jgi:hypothetical protein